MVSNSIFGSESAKLPSLFSLRIIGPLGVWLWWFLGLEDFRLWNLRPENGFIQIYAFNNLDKSNWAVLSDEQMSNGWSYPLLNDEQMSNKVRVEHQPAKIIPICSDQLQ